MYYSDIQLDIKYTKNGFCKTIFLWEIKKVLINEHLSPLSGLFILFYDQCNDTFGDNYDLYDGFTFGILCKSLMIK